MFKLSAIGETIISESEMYIQLDKPYIGGLKAIDGFGNLQILFWFDRFDNEESRNLLILDSPYKNGPDQLGVFATRSPQRPNLIGLTCVNVLSIDYEKGRIYVPYIDTMNHTPILDIKPYTPASDRVENIQLPSWCAHWPKSIEASGAFDWESEFNF